MTPRAVRPWFRFYVEAMPDRKIRRLTPTQRWLWVAILSAARESPEPGVLMIAEGVAMTNRELASYADVPEREVGPALKLMAVLHMVELDGEAVVVVNWPERQFETDNVTARTRAHRERSKERSKERSQPVPENVYGNIPETETETETEQEQERHAKTQVSLSLEVVPAARPTTTELAIPSTPTADTIVAEWIDHCAKRPPAPVIGQTGKAIRAMLTEGIDPNDIRRGVAAWMAKGLHPSTLPSVINETMNGHGTSSRRQRETDDLFTRAAKRMGVTQ